MGAYRLPSNSIEPNQEPSSLLNTSLSLDEGNCRYISPRKVSDGVLFPRNHFIIPASGFICTSMLNTYQHLANGIMNISHTGDDGLDKQTCMCQSIQTLVHRIRCHASIPLAWDQIQYEFHLQSARLDCLVDGLTMH